MMSDVTERDEFLLSQLLDGDLPPVEADALRERMARDPALREAYESLARVNAAIERQRDDQPVEFRAAPNLDFHIQSVAVDLIQPPQNG